MLLGEPPQTPYDLHFSLFRMPVRVHPFFWLIAVLLGFSAGPQLIDALIWVVAMFLAIMVHELGHALVMRRYGFSPRIILYGMGGLASSGPAQAYGSAGSSTRAQILISAAGPGAGFLLAALIVGLLVLIGAGVNVFLLGGFLPYIEAGSTVGSQALTNFIDDLLHICMFWGIMNLLPVYPLDGGQIAQKALVAVNPVDGVRQSLLLSIITAIAVAVIGLTLLGRPFLFVAVMFGFLAYFSYRALQFHQGRGPW